MTSNEQLSIGKYHLPLNLYYDPQTHLWVDRREPKRARFGFDPLGSETSGDVVAVSFEPVGARLTRGQSFGSLEAAKFVGPLIAPVSGTIAAHNASAIADPSQLNTAPLECWMVEVTLEDPEPEFLLLLKGPARVRAWFEAEIERFETKGMIAQ